MVDRPDFAKAYLVAQPETSRRPVGPVFDSQSTVSADQTHLNHDVHLASTSEIARTDLRGYNTLEKANTFTPGALVTHHKLRRAHVADRKPDFRENPAQSTKADARIRTGDPFITSEVLYQLSYVGVRFGYRQVVPLPKVMESVASGAPSDRVSGRAACGGLGGPFLLGGRRLGLARTRAV